MEVFTSCDFRVVHVFALLYFRCFRNRMEVRYIFHTFGSWRVICSRTWRTISIVVFIVAFINNVVSFFTSYSKGCAAYLSVDSTTICTFSKWVMVICFIFRARITLLVFTCFPSIFQPCWRSKTFALERILHRAILVRTKWQWVLNKQIQLTEFFIFQLQIHWQLQIAAFWTETTLSSLPWSTCHSACMLRVKVNHCLWNLLQTLWSRAIWFY